MALLIGSKKIKTAVFISGNGSNLKNLIKVISKEENLIEITGDNLKQIIWHIGNRHLPCQIEENRILIQDDAVILDMVLKLHGNVKKVFEKFKPEGGAYGMGRTHSHKH